MLGVEWHRIAVTWAANTLGTRQRHIAISYQLSRSADAEEYD